MDTSITNASEDNQPSMAVEVISAPGVAGKCYRPNSQGDQVWCSVSSDKGNLDSHSGTASELSPIYDINYAGVEDNLVNPSCMPINSQSLKLFTVLTHDTEIYNTWRCQSDINFGFVPLGEQ